MAKRLVERMVEYCEICDRETYTCASCIVCDRDLCLTCKATIPGSIVPSSPPTCNDCAKRDDVKLIYEQWSPKLQHVKRLRDNQLRQLDPEDAA